MDGRPGPEAMEPISEHDPLLLPEGSRLVHIGPPGTGSTSVQAAFRAAREAAFDQGVRYAGDPRNVSRAVRAVTGPSSTDAGHRPVAIGEWHRLVRDIRRAREPRLVVGSDLLAGATPEAIRRIVDDVDRARVHVAVTLRPLTRVIPSMWLQHIEGGRVIPFEDWVRALLDPAPDAATPTFWTVHRHDRLVERWSAVVGPDRMTAIVVDEGDQDAVLRVFERLVGLRAGTLVRVPEPGERSLTLPEAEAVRAFNELFVAEVDDRALYARVMQLGAAVQMKRRLPPTDEPGVELPADAAKRVGAIQAEMVERIAASGVRVVGDLGLLAAPHAGPAAAGASDARISPEIAAAVAMGILVSTGAARRDPATGSRPDDAAATALALVPTSQVAGTLAIRAWRGTAAGAGGARRRVRQLRGRLPAVLGR